MNTKLKYVNNWTELAKQANWSVRKLSKLCNVSSRSLERFFLKQMRSTPRLWMSKERHTIAETLLRNWLSVKETAAVLGFKQPQHFSEEFKRNCGRCPTEFNVTGQSAADCRVFG